MNKSQKSQENDIANNTLTNHFQCKHWRQEMQLLRGQSRKQRCWWHQCQQCRRSHRQWQSRCWSRWQHQSHQHLQSRQSKQHQHRGWRRESHQKCQRWHKPLHHSTHPQCVWGCHGRHNHCWKHKKGHATIGTESAALLFKFTMKIILNLNNLLNTSPY